MVSPTSFCPPTHSMPQTPGRPQDQLLDPTPVSVISFNASEASSSPSTDPLPNKGRNWRTLVLNANGLEGMEKRANFASLVEYTKPDAIIISETHLQQDICSAEFMPPGYSAPIRKDRDGRGGGVLIALKDCYTISEVELPDLSAEIVWGEVNLRGNRRLFLGAYYRTPSGDASHQHEAFTGSPRVTSQDTK